MKSDTHLLWLALVLVPAVSGCRVNAAMPEARSPDESGRRNVAIQLMQAEHDQLNDEER